MPSMMGGTGSRPSCSALSTSMRTPMQELNISSAPGPLWVLLVRGGSVLPPLSLTVLGGAVPVPCRWGMFAADITGSAGLLMEGVASAFFFPFLFRFFPEGPAAGLFAAAIREEVAFVSPVGAACTTGGVVWGAVVCGAVPVFPLRSSLFRTGQVTLLAGWSPWQFAQVAGCPFGRGQSLAR